MENSFEKIHQSNREKEQSFFSQLNLSGLMNALSDFEWRSYTNAQKFSSRSEMVEFYGKQFKEFKEQYDETLSSLGLKAKLYNRQGLFGIRIILKDKEKLFRYFDFLDKKEKFDFREISNINFFSETFYNELDYFIDWERISDEDLELLSGLKKISDYFQKFSPKIKKYDSHLEMGTWFDTMLQVGEMFGDGYLKQYFLARKLGLFKTSQESDSVLNLHLLMRQRIAGVPDTISTKEIYQYGWNLILEKLKILMDELREKNPRGYDIFSKKTISFLTSSLNKLEETFSHPQKREDKIYFPIFLEVIKKMKEKLNNFK